MERSKDTVSPNQRASCQSHTTEPDQSGSTKVPDMLAGLWAAAKQENYSSKLERWNGPLIQSIEGRGDRFVKGWT